MNQEFEKDGQVRELNLSDMAQNFMDGLQLHTDMLAFNLASREAVGESAYKKRAAAPQIMPSGKRHQNFEQMQAYARDLLIRQVMNDCINLSSTALNNTHFFFALLKESKGNKKFNTDVQELANSRHEEFLKSPIWEKFKILKNNYGISTDYEDTILGLLVAIKALVKNNGILEVDHFSEFLAVPLKLKIKKLCVEKGPSAEEKRVVRIIDEEKIFYPGDSFVISDLEIQRLLVTVAGFADFLFKSLGSYAKKIRASN